MQVIGNHALTPKHDPEERVGLGTGAVLLVEVMEDDPTFHDDGKNEDDGSDDEDNNDDDDHDQDNWSWVSEPN